MDPAKRSHYRIPEGPRLALSPLGELLLSTPHAEEGSVADRIRRTPPGAGAGGGPGEVDYDAFWLSHSPMAREQFQKKLPERGKAHSRASGFFCRGDRRGGGVRRLGVELPAHVEPSGSLRSLGMSAAAATPRMAMSWFESPGLRAHRGVVVFDQEQSALMAWDTPGAELPPRPAEVHAEIKLGSCASSGGTTIIRGQKRSPPRVDAGRSRSWFLDGPGFRSKWGEARKRISKGRKKSRSRAFSRRSNIAWQAGSSMPLCGPSWAPRLGELGVPSENRSASLTSEAQFRLSGLDFRAPNHLHVHHSPSAMTPRTSITCPPATA